jgi:hypothetical protein
MSRAAPLLLLTATALVACSGTQASGPQSRPCEGVECVLGSLEGKEEEGSAARWEEHITPSFRVLHLGSAALAARVAQGGEAQRRQQLKLWTVAAPDTPWSPRCDVYLFPSTQVLIQMSGREAKAGSASARPSQLYRGRMISRRINLAADDEHLLESTLPHEISHVVVTDLLEGKRVPLWADEGLAVLAELSDQTRTRYAEVVADYLARRQTFAVPALLQMTRYPDREYTSLFYAQSTSLTRLFLDRSGRSTLLAFLRASAAGSVETALKQHYGMTLLELQNLWLDRSGKSDGD